MNGCRGAGWGEAWKPDCKRNKKMKRVSDRDPFFKFLAMHKVYWKLQTNNDFSHYSVLTSYMWAFK